MPENADTAAPKNETWEIMHRYPDGSVYIVSRFYGTSEEAQREADSRGDGYYFQDGRA